MKFKSLGLLSSAWLVAVFAVEACVSDEPAGSSSTDGGASDGSTQSDGNVTGDSGSSGDAGACNPSGSFGDPVEIASLHVPGAKELWVTFSPDGLSALVARLLPGGSSGNLYLSDRGSTSEDFPPGVLLGPEINDNGLDGGLSGGGRGTFADAKLTVFFEAKTTGPNNVDIYQAKRDSASSATFHERTLVPGLSGSSDHGQPFLVNDSLYSFFNSAGTFTIQETHRGLSGFDTPQHLTNLDGFVGPVVTLDEKTVYLGKSGRIYQADRSDPTGPFGVPTEISSVVSTGHETPSDVSADGCTLFFTRTDSDGGNEDRVFMSTRSK